VRSGGIDALIIDSVAALVPRAELEGDMGDQHVGLQARLMSQALRKLTATIHKSMTCVIFINQIRMKIGVMFGSPKPPPGETPSIFMLLSAWTFAASERSKKVSRSRAAGPGSRWCEKTKSLPLSESRIRHHLRHGHFQGRRHLDLAASFDIVEKSGAWYSFKGERMGQGRENAKKFLADNADIRNQVVDLIKEKNRSQRTKAGAQQ